MIRKTYSDKVTSIKLLTFFPDLLAKLRKNRWDLIKKEQRKAKYDAEIHQDQKEEDKKEEDKDVLPQLKMQYRLISKQLEFTQKAQERENLRMYQSIEDGIKMQERIKETEEEIEKNKLDKIKKNQQLLILKKNRSERTVQLHENKEKRMKLKMEEERKIARDQMMETIYDKMDTLRKNEEKKNECKEKQMKNKEERVLKLDLLFLKIE